MNTHTTTTTTTAPAAAPCVAPTPNWMSLNVTAKDEHGVWHTSVCLDRMFENGHMIQSWGCGEDAETSLANARLIAAAPDLLAALDMLADLCEGRELFPNAVAAARAAITKAREAAR